MMRRSVCLLIAGLVVLSEQAVAQETYPNRTVRWVVPLIPLI
jgi:hypothetical protein